MQNQFFAPFSPNTYLLIMVIDRTPARIHLLDSIIYNWSAANLAGRYYLLAGRRWREDKHPAFVGREASRRRAPPPIFIVRLGIISTPMHMTISGYFRWFTFRKSRRDVRVSSRYFICGNPNRFRCVASLAWRRQYYWSSHDH